MTRMIDARALHPICSTSSRPHPEQIMRRVRFLAAFAILAAACLLAPFAQSQPAKSKSPKLEPIAETKLLMNGIADPNFKGLGKMFAEKPKDDDAWAFARGRALLIAETGNLLMIRPPKERE